MKACKRQLAIVFMVLAFGFLVLPGADGAKKTYYAVEINGVVCGYSETSESLLQEEGRKYVQQETNVFVMLSLLGSEFNSKIKVMSLLDPVTRRACRTVTVIDQGNNHLVFELKVSGREAVLVSPRSRDPKKIAVYPGLLIGSDELFLQVKRDFITQRASEASYDILEALEEEVQRSTFRKTGEERIELAGKTFPALIIEQVNAKTGVKITYWLAPEHDDFVKYTVSERSVYLADRRVIDRIKVANMDAAIFTKTDAAIVDVPAIVYMKLKAKIAPTGVTMTVDGLNVPGQKFSGTVNDNVIDGVLEIEHKRYDGSAAPPFPPGFAKDTLLKKYLEPERFIESDDPVLKKKASAICAGAADSWQAATRLSQWVAENIAYAVLAGSSARSTYDIRAGECGAHSMLLAAFCRAVGIPARVVFGAMYVPNQGGGFGQHAWNEIYMGQAGWVPVDATAYETDFVDSGHIRISEVKSVTSSSFNGREFAVLDYRLAGKAAAVTGATGREFAPYLGMFANPQGSRTLTVLEKEGNLALDIPGQMVLPFNAADEKGRWLCKFAPHVYLVFGKEDRGRAIEMELHQVTPLPRKVAAEDTAAGVPSDLAPYVGTYLLAAANAEFTVLIQDGRLAVYDPMEKATIRLQPPVAEGAWREELTKNTIFFEKDGQGKVVAMKIDAVDNFQRGELAASIIEQTIQAQGLEAGLRQYPVLKAANRDGVFFNEPSFNQLGYRYLAAGKLNEAIAVFTLNVQAYPRSFNVYDSLAEACMKNNQNDLAVENFKKSLQLNPKNENARKMLEKLGAR
ncbi:MAG: lasso peptide biosynthesis protein [Acidobacteria bacterium]|nr:lasso peptide biosynthesis protein [Acidobacteriota bacterium]